MFQACKLSYSDSDVLFPFLLTFFLSLLFSCVFLLGVQEDVKHALQASQTVSRTRSTDEERYGMLLCYKMPK